MSTSSPITEPRTCPEWCTSEADHPWYDSGDAEPIRDHDGPSFGPVQVSGQQQCDGSVAFSIMAPEPVEAFISAAQARNLAHSLQQAAEWIEPATVRLAGPAAIDTLRSMREACGLPVDHLRDDMTVAEVVEATTALGRTMAALYTARQEVDQ